MDISLSHLIGLRGRPPSPMWRFYVATILPCLVPSATNRHCARIPGSKNPGETSMMMNDLREAHMPPAEMRNTPKIVVALVVALGFGAIGAYSYETGTWNSPPKQIVASKETPPPAPVDNATPSEAPLQSAADLPPAPPPAPVKDVPAQASAKAAPAPAIKVARAQASAPSLPQAPAAQPAATISAQASPEPAAPAASIPEPPAPQASAVAAPANAPPQEAPAPAALQPRSSP